MYTVKSVKTFHGHDGYGWECNLYNGKQKLLLLLKMVMAVSLNFIGQRRQFQRQTQQDQQTSINLSLNHFVKLYLNGTVLEK